MGALSGRLGTGCAPLAVALVGCGSHRSAQRANACADLMKRSVAHPSGTTNAELRRYVLDAYCTRFAQQGWIYPDGAWKIDATVALTSGARHASSCAVMKPGEPARTVPCASVEAPHDPTIDCAAYRFTRRSEVRSYLAKLQRTRPVECDDGTPLAKLGVP